MEQLADQDIAVRLAGLHAAGRLGHAYLFAGPKGMGKYATALALAAKVNCLKKGEEGCDCAVCRKIAGGNHPDVLSVQKPEDKTGISIDQVRDLIGRLEYRSLEARVRFAVIRDAELMPEPAANAFLKTLEEPRPGTVLILTTPMAEALLPTIRSRCQTVFFSAMSHDRLAGILSRKHGLSEDDARVLAAFGQGSPGRALELGQAFLDRRRQVLDLFLGAGDSEGFVKAVGSDRDGVREALMVVLMACRDALFIKAGDPPAVVNRDREVEIRRFAERQTAEAIAAQAERVSDAIRRVDGNQNVKIILTLVRELIQ
jgi:DNA polymerase-3 subunit delta'